MKQVGDIIKAMGLIGAMCYMTVLNTTVAYVGLALFFLLALTVVQRSDK